MNKESGNISAFSIAFIIIGALFGAAFASGQEVMKFFCSYGTMGALGFAVCFILYMTLGYMAYQLVKVRDSDKMEEIVAPADNIILRKLISLVMMFCFLVILVALLAAGDALCMSQLGLPKGAGGLFITALVVATNIVGFDGIKKIMPLIIPVMLVVMLATIVGILLFTEPAAEKNPGQFMSPLAPNWFIGAVLYLAYNFIAVIPIISTMPKNKESGKTVFKGMFAGFLSTCAFGLLLYLAVMTDIDKAGTFEIPMAYLSGKLSPIAGTIYSLVMAVAIYASSSNCLYGLTKEIKKENRKKRAAIIILIGTGAYFVSLAGFSVLITYVYPVQGYSCILIAICLIITYFRFRNRKRRQPSQKAD
ncbi:MAG: hypothetical protein Q4C14_03260 [Bacillota bacterium]|nr:hypothetical protein [Bacillota bacterium]